MLIRYLGQCGFAFQFKSVCLVTDPYLSDYVDKNCSDDQLSWVRAYPPPLTLKEVKPDVILISHGHVDHLDPWTLGPYAQEAPAVPIVVPALVRTIGERFGFENVIPAFAEKTIRHGDLTITPIPCAHTEIHYDADGNCCELSYFIECEGVRIFFAGDMSLYPGVAERVEAFAPDIVALPVNGRSDRLTALNVIGNLNHVEAIQLAKQCRARLLIPMHHDLYSVNGCDPEIVRKAADAQGVPILSVRPGDSYHFE